MRKKMLPILFMFLLCIIMTRAGTANAQDEGTISVDPPTVTVDAPGIDFTINITMTGCTHMVDQYIVNNITWDPTIIELQTGTDADIVEGPWMKSVPGSTTIFLAMNINNTEGKIGEITCAYMTVTEVNGTGVMFSIKFRSKAVGETPINIGYALLLDPTTDPEWYLDPTNGLVLNDGSVTVIPEFSASLLLPLLAIATLIAVIAAKLPRKRQTPLPRL